MDTQTSFNQLKDPGCFETGVLKIEQSIFTHKQTMALYNHCDNTVAQPYEIILPNFFIYTPLVLFLIWAIFMAFLKLHDKH